MSYQYFYKRTVYTCCRKSYKYVKRERAFPQVSVSSTSGIVSSSMDSVDGRFVVKVCPIADPPENCHLTVNKLPKT